MPPPPALLRMIDANANRAREGLRVMEDLARFVLDDGTLSGAIKSARHDLAAAMDSLGAAPLALAASRDTPGDVGVTIKEPCEARRESASAIASAAAKRTTEALRAIEECAKTSPGAPAAWRTFESLRYRVYELEKRLVLGLGTGRATQWRLCVLVTPGATLLEWTEVVRRSIAGGADCIQLRVKDVKGGDAEWLDHAHRCRELVSREHASASFIVNDRADIALLCRADGVHLGQTDLPVHEVRKLAGDALLVGVSTHNLAEARAAALDGADYCGVGAMFPTSTKDRALSGIAYLREYLGEPVLERIPHLAIGGVAPDNIHDLAEAGCRGVAVSSAVCTSDAPEKICEKILRGLSTAPRGARANTITASTA